MKVDGSRSREGGWLDATSVVDGDPTARARARQRSSRNRRLAVMVVALALPIAVLGWLLATGDHLPALNRTEPPTSLRVAGFVLSGLGLVLSVAGLVRLVRGGMWGQAWRSPTVSLSAGERRRLLRRLREGVPGPAEQYRVTADLAERIAKQGPLLLTTGGLICSAAGQGLSGDAPFLRWLAVLVVAAELVAGALVHRDIGRARRWLEQYPRHPGEQGARA